MVKLNKRALAKTDDVKAEICSILAALRGCEEGKAAAARGLDETGSGETRKVDAMVLSMELARETRQRAASVPLRYKNRSFTVSGKVKYVIKDGDVYRVAYDVPEPREMALKPGPRDPHFKIDIHCNDVSGTDRVGDCVASRRACEVHRRLFEFR